MRRLTYAEAGVDIHQENRSIEAMKTVLKSRRKGFGAPMTMLGIGLLGLAVSRRILARRSPSD
jgi:phosphoribosylaminoimidazole (AIR) synthetase